jgi:hypothetical protein
MKDWFKKKMKDPLWMGTAGLVLLGLLVVAIMVLGSC